MEIKESTLSFFGLLIIAGLGIMAVFAPRKYATLPLIASACFITYGQQIVIADLNFTGLRMIILLGWLRVFIRNELEIRWNLIDKLILIYAGFSFLKLFQVSSQDEGLSLLVGHLGFLYNLIGIYFLFRIFIRDYDDIELAIRYLGLCLIIPSGFMIFEMVTGKNMFSIFGGVDEFSLIRDGYVRCQGPFRHPIMAGTVGAISMPLFVGLLRSKGRGKALALIGGIGSTAMVVASHSTGPALSYGFGLIGLLCWYCRDHMKKIRWMLLVSLVALHVVMKAPVWYLFSRVSDLIGGGGWHRSFLIDQAIAHINEWWIVGTSKTGHWMPYSLAIDPEAADLTNQFIAEGVSGGLIRIALFIIIIGVCFRTIGKTLQRMEGLSHGQRILTWSLGVSLFSHVISFFSVSYYDQTIMMWYMCLSCIAAVQTLSVRTQVGMS